MKSIIANRRLTKIFITLFLLILILITFGSFQKNDTKAYESNLLIDKEPPLIYDLNCHLSPETVKWNEKDCTFNKKPTNRVVLLVGDSHAAQWFPGLLKLSNKFNFTLVSFTKSSCPAFFQYYPVKDKDYKACNEYQKEVKRKINMLPKESIVFTSALMVGPETYGSRNSTYFSKYEKSVKKFTKLLKRNARIEFLEDTPYPRIDVIRCLQLHNSSKCTFANKWHPNDEFMKILHKYNINYIYTQNEICPGDICLAAIADTPSNNKFSIWRDSSHLSINASSHFSYLLEKFI